MPSSYSVGKHYEAFIKRLVASGRYASASEVVRAALRELEAKSAVPALSIDELRLSLADVREADDYFEVGPVLGELDGIVQAAEERDRSAA
ncbi:MAG: type II toxin-antitoxin system ParD family antitoxin [Rhizobiaceae bacterium]|jgi:antitoxin ParD1/3/4|nr:type II toxin-antitoxin system ParD family antitoxin [Rhizobiaceae bacterium]